ncbi:MAG: histidine kinase N-terminal 7TM domain-containing protein [Bacillota bacterium]
MPWHDMLYSVPLGSAAAISLALAFYAWKRRRPTGYISFVFLMLSVAEWSLGYTMELGSADLHAKLFWAKVQFLGMVVVPAAWLIFIVINIGRETWLKYRIAILIWAEPVIVCILVWTNDFHKIIWDTMSMPAGGLPASLHPAYRWGFWMHTVYSYMVIFFGAHLLFMSHIQSPHFYRRQTGMLLVGGFAPWVVNIMHIFRLGPIPDLDFTPLALSLSGLAVSLGVFRFNFLDIMPVARDAVIENMRDLVIVLDDQNRIVDLNPSARRIIGETYREVIGRSAFEIFSHWRELMEKYRDTYEADAEIAVMRGEEERHFDLSISPLRAGDGKNPGKLIMLKDITERKNAEKLKTSLGQMQEAMEETIRAMARIVEMRDPYTAGHQRRVAKIASAIAEKMGLPEGQVYEINMAALIHDIGKIYVPSEILSKPGRLSAIEFSMIKAHSQVGYDILKNINFPWPIARIVLQHHERIDGSGYPSGLKGEDILLEAKILGVADVVEAMSNYRPYRERLGVESAIMEITENQEILYCREVVEACSLVFRERQFPID